MLSPRDYFRFPRRPCRRIQTMDEVEEECRVGWLSVQSDLSLKLSNPQLLKYALQVVGRNPSDRAIEGYWSRCGGSMSYQQFSLVMQREKNASMAHLMQAFRKIDINNNGFITTQELQRILTKRGEKMSLEDVQAILAEVDRSGDGRLDYAEFCHVFLNTTRECVTATRRRTGQMAAGRDASTSRSHARKPKAARNDRDRKVSAQRRHSRREEIRKQLYSSEDTVSSTSSKLQVLSGVVTPQRNRQRPPYPSSAPPPAGMMEDLLQRKEQQEEERLSLPLVARIVHTTACGHSPHRGHQHNESSDEEGGSTPGTTMPQHSLPSSGMPSLRKPSLPTALESVVPGGGGMVSGSGGSDDHGRGSGDGGGGGGSGDRGRCNDGAGGGTGNGVMGGSGDGARGGSGNSTRGGSGDGARGGSGDVARDGSGDGAKDGSGNSTRGGSGDGARGGSGDGARGGSGNSTRGGSGDGARGGSGDVARDGSGDGARDGSGNSTRGGSGDGDVSRSGGGSRGGSGDGARDGSGDGARDGSRNSARGGSGNGDVSRSGDGVRGGSGVKNDSVGGSLSSVGVDQTWPEQEDIGNEDGGSGEKRMSVATATLPPPRKPKNIQDWYSISGKGCFYLDSELEYPSSSDHEGKLIQCHRYHLTLPVPTKVWVEAEVASPGVLATDVLLFVCRVNEQEEATDAITYTQHKVGPHWVCHMDLEAGQYALLPYTSGCHLKALDEDSNFDHRSSTCGAERKPLTSRGTGGSVLLDVECKAAFQEIFHRIDLDGNGSISRTEFDFFNEVTCGEVCDDDAWGIVQAHFEMTCDGEVTLQGFLALHEMAAADPEGGEEELWQCLQAMGYNQQLQLTQACPFLFSVWSEECEGEVEIVDLLPFAPILCHSICRWVLERGVVVPAQGMEEGELSVRSFTASNLTTIVVENKSFRTHHVQLDVSQSVNCLCNRESRVHVLELLAQATRIGYYLQPADVHAPHIVKCIASKILS